MQTHWTTLTTLVESQRCISAARKWIARRYGAAGRVDRNGTTEGRISIGSWCCFSVLSLCSFRIIAAGGMAVLRRRSGRHQVLATGGHQSLQRGTAPPGLAVEALGNAAQGIRNNSGL